jgi:hypothetical protein
MRELYLDDMDHLHSDLYHSPTEISEKEGKQVRWRWRKGEKERLSLSFALKTGFFIYTPLKSSLSAFRQYSSGPMWHYAPVIPIYMTTSVDAYNIIL